MPAAADVDKVLDDTLASYTRVELPAAALEVCLARRAHAPARERFLGLPAPVWAAIAFALLLLLGLNFYRPAWFGHHPQPRLANERTTLQAISPDEPLTPEQKQLIHILLTDPSALATMQPHPLGKDKPAPKPPKKP